VSVHTPFNKTVAFFFVSILCRLPKSSKLTYLPSLRDNSFVALKGVDSCPNLFIVVVFDNEQLHIQEFHGLIVKIPLLLNDATSP